MLHGLLCGILLLLPAPAGAGPDAGPGEAAAAFLAALPEGERAAARWSFEDAERSDVHYAPLGLDGVRHGELGPEVRAHADALLAAVLSPSGRERVRMIRDLERDVAALEGERLFGFASRWMRDPGRYFWAFFGEPAEDAPWGFRFEGHHLSLNVTSVPGRPLGSTPLFLGAQPRVVPEGMPSEGAAALGEEERMARALYASLDPEQRAAATLPYEEGRGHMLGQVARIEAPAPVGVAWSDLRAPQRESLAALVDGFAALFAEPTAAARRAEIAAARSGLHFAFVASDDPPHAYYARVSGPGLLIELDNTSDGDHVHAVWHRPGADFADDLLARHWRESHGIAIGR